MSQAQLVDLTRLNIELSLIVVLEILRIRIPENM